MLAGQTREQRAGALAVGAMADEALALHDLLGALLIGCVR
jgi:hypothetical protein